MTDLSALSVYATWTHDVASPQTIAPAPHHLLMQDSVTAVPVAGSSLVAPVLSGLAAPAASIVSATPVVATLAAPSAIPAAPAMGDQITVAAGTSAAALQSLINGAAAGSTIHLAAGHFSFDRTILVARDDISVVGAGSDKTVIDVAPGLGAEAFKIGQGNTSGSYKLAADVATGSTEITLTGSHSFVAGDFVYLSRASTTAFYDSIGDTEWRNTDVALRTSIAQVASVNGNKITLASGVHFDFVPGETTVSEISMAERVSVGGFTVSYGLNKADPSNFSNTMSNYDRNAVIEVKGTAGLNLFDITSRDVPSLGVNVAASIGASVDHMTMTGSHNKGDSGNGYAIQIRDVYNSRFTNLTDEDMRHSVVFASWTSAAGNFVHVLQTDRDINFHGGRDHDNVVMVDASIRDVASDIIGMSVFVNTESSHYGTATDASTNITKFGHVVGTRLSDDVHGYDNGSWLSGMGGNDTLTGGAGNDLLTGGDGHNLLFGGAGVDIASYSGVRANFKISTDADGVHVTDTVANHYGDILNQVEWLLFDDGALRVSDMAFLATSAVAGVFGGAGTYAQGATPTPSPAPALAGTGGDDVFDVTVAGTIVHGLAGWDIVNAAVDFTMSEDVEQLILTGASAINGTGSGLADRIHGNRAANILSGLGGDDMMHGGNGNDHLSGGEGADSLFAGAGDDVIDGGAGRDKLKGGDGADVFVFVAVADSTAAAPDLVRDFHSGQDRIDLSAIDANTLLAGNQDFVLKAGPGGAGVLWLAGGMLYGDVNGDGLADLAINFGSQGPAASDLLL